MLAEHEQRFRAIARELRERPAGDYAELLRCGDVSSPDGVDAEQWRDEIRRQARQDKIRVSTSRDGNRAFTMLNRKIPDDQAIEALRRAADQMTLLGEVAERSAELGHKLGRWLGHHDESIASCERCRARVYVRRGDWAVLDGEALTDRCPSPSA